MDKFNTEAIAQHLKKGSFAPIFEQSNEKDNDIALKLMCIIDFHAQKLDLYKRVQDSKSPKLLTKLMQFSSFGTFKYFDYQVGKRIGKRVLKCKFCELVGPYGLILTHTVINHNVHIGLKNCAYCHRTELNEHLNEDVLHECYAKYMEREHIERDEVVCDIVTEFYAMLKRLSDKLKITTPRHHSFGGKGHKDAERFGRGGDNDIDTDENETVFKIRKSKNISGRSGPLDREFKRVISILYGGNNFSRLIQQQSVNAYSNGNDQAITISDVDETRSTAAATQAQRYLNTSDESNGGRGDTAASVDDINIEAGNANGTGVSVLPQIEKKKSDSDPFLQLVAHRLDCQPENKRRKMENAMIKAMIEVETEKSQT